MFGLLMKMVAPFLFGAGVLLVAGPGKMTSAAYPVFQAAAGGWPGLSEDGLPFQTEVLRKTSAASASATTTFVDNDGRQMARLE